MEKSTNQSSSNNGSREAAYPVTINFKLIPESLFSVYTENTANQEEETGIKLSTMNQSLKARILSSDLEFMPEIITYKLKGLEPPKPGEDEYGEGLEATLCFTIHESVEISEDCIQKGVELAGFILRQKAAGEVNRAELKKRIDSLIVSQESYTSYLTILLILGVSEKLRKIGCFRRFLGFRGGRSA